MQNYSYYSFDFVLVFQEHHTKLGEDTTCGTGETVVAIAQRYRHADIVEFYEWCDLLRKYKRLLESLLRHIDKAVPQDDPVFTAEDLDRYQAGCEEKLETIKTIKFRAMPTAALLKTIVEACELRFKIQTFIPKPEDLAKEKRKNGAKGKKKK